MGNFEIMLGAGIIVAIIIVAMIISTAKKKEKEQQEQRDLEKLISDNANSKPVAASELFDSQNSDNRIVGRDVEDNAVQIKEKPISWEDTTSYSAGVKEKEVVIEAKQEIKPVVTNTEVIEEEQIAHIFLVDDSFVVRKKVSDLLKKNNYLVTTKNDGFEAFGFLTSEGNHKPDLIITDIEMPNMNGIQLIEALRKEERYQNTPIMVISAHVENHMVLMETGSIQGFISKPYQDDDLLNQVEYLVNNN